MPSSSNGEGSVIESASDGIPLIVDVSRAQTNEREPKHLHVLGDDQLGDNRWIFLT